jgi:formate dehydrogenase subunit beta
MSEIEQALRREVARLLDENVIDLFVGYADSPLPLRAPVCVVRDPANVDRLVWNRFCTSNLAALLPGLLPPPGDTAKRDSPRVGVLSKGCVSRSLVTLIKAHQVPRDALFVVGIGCEGMIDRHKIAQRMGVAEVRDAVLEPPTLIVRGLDGSEQQVEIADVLLDSCRACRHRSAVFSDSFVGERIEALPDAAVHARVDDFAARPADERWAAFAAEMARCIRCYACREACPNCFCTDCFADDTNPRWIGVTTEPTDVVVFHLGRAFHQAGRCVDCGACVAACPQGIDLRLLYQRVNQDVEELFHTDVGVSLEEPEPLCCFALEDDQRFMTEP